MKQGIQSPDFRFLEPDSGWEEGPLYWSITRRAIILHDLDHIFTTDFYIICINWAIINSLFDQIIFSDKEWDARKPFNRQRVIDFITTQGGW